MVEVFCTDIPHHAAAFKALAVLHKAFPEYTANLDLDDCDRILRVECPTEPVDSFAVIELLATMGHRIEVLEDEVPGQQKELLQKVAGEV